MARPSAETHTKEYTARIAAFAARCRGEKAAKVTKASKAVKKDKVPAVKTVKASSGKTKAPKKSTPVQQLARAKADFPQETMED